MQTKNNQRIFKSITELYLNLTQMFRQ